MVNSQNGWAVDPPRRLRTVPGSTVQIVVADGPAGDVLMYLASQFDKRVEDIDPGIHDDWGYANRTVRGSTSISNHASATAIDLNATQHPLGAVGTFTANQREAIRQILVECGGVVRWGGNYSGRKDEMHFEIVGTYNQTMFVAMTLKLAEESKMTPNEFFMAGVWHVYRTDAEAKAAGLPIVNGVQERTEKHTFAEWYTNVCVRIGNLDRNVTAATSYLKTLAERPQ